MNFDALPFQIISPISIIEVYIRRKMRGAIQFNGQPAFRTVKNRQCSDLCRLVAEISYPEAFGLADMSIGSLPRMLLSFEAFSGDFLALACSRSRVYARSCVAIEQVFFPSLQRRGGCGINKMARSHRSAADGVVNHTTRLKNAF